MRIGWFMDNLSIFLYPKERTTEQRNSNTFGQLNLVCIRSENIFCTQQ